MESYFYPGSTSTQEERDALFEKINREHPNIKNFRVFEDGIQVQPSTFSVVNSIRIIFNNEIRGGFVPLSGRECDKYICFERNRQYEALQKYNVLFKEFIDKINTQNKKANKLASVIDHINYPYLGKYNFFNNFLFNIPRRDFIELLFCTFESYSTINLHLFDLFMLNMGVLTIQNFDEYMNSIRSKNDEYKQKLHEKSNEADNIIQNIYSFCELFYEQVCKYYNERNDYYLLLLSEKANRGYNLSKGIIYLLFLYLNYYCKIDYYHMSIYNPKILFNDLLDDTKKSIEDDSVPCGSYFSCLGYKYVPKDSNNEY